MKDYENHPLADLFPIIPASELKDLIADIKERGLQSPIILYEGKILDGRHRYEGCSQAGVKPKFEIYKGDDPIGFVLSANLRRRHLTDGQRAMIAAKLANMKQGERTDVIASKAGAEPSDNCPKVSQQKAADDVGVSAKSVGKAAAIIDASPRLAKQVDAGKLSLNAAHQQVKAKEAEKSPVVDDAGYPIPTKIQPLWERRHEIQELMTSVSRVKTRIEKGRGENDPLFLQVSQIIIDQLERSYSFLTDAKPYAVCLTCQGRAADACRVCKGTGLISKFGYETRGDQKARAIREKGLAKP